MQQATLDHLENSREACKEWASIPAPQRGEVVRQIGHALREKKTLLDRFRSILTFVITLSRMLPGSVLPSER